MFTINKKDAEAIAKQATESFEECLSKYDSLKYPEEPYLEWKKVFVNPQDVHPTTLNRPWNGNTDTGAKPTMFRLTK
jgi:hypothetical protein